jgi:mevalonate kinase
MMKPTGTTGKGKAHAKLIIMGEHFVVPFTDADGAEHPGSAALAVPLPKLWTEVTLTTHSSFSCELDGSAASLGFKKDSLTLMENAVRFAANRFRWDLGMNPLKAFSISSFPCARGLGSSASFSVALAKGFAEISSSETADIRTEAQGIENLFHGKSSGLDTSAIVATDPILYRNGTILGTFSPRAVDFVVADSGPRDSSASLVSRTMEIRKKKPGLWNSLSTQIEDLVQKCMEHLERSDGASEVAHFIRNSQEILAQIGLTTSRIDTLLELGTRSGALAGKISGAGAGGVVLFVTPPGRGADLSRKLEGAGASVITTTQAYSS